MCGAAETHLDSNPRLAVPAAPKDSACAEFFGEIFMLSLRILFALLISAIVLAVLTWVAVTHFLYWRIWWFDIPMHILGGVWAALFAAWITVYRGGAISLPLCLLFALLTGIAWEIFEYSEGITNAYHFNYTTDVFKDVVVGLLGGIAGWQVARLLVPAKNTSPNAS